MNVEDCIKQLGVLPLARYCQITGEKPNAIYQRRHKGIWQVGVHLYQPVRGNWWVMLPAVQHWARGRDDSYQAIVNVERLLAEAIKAEKKSAAP